MSFSPDPSKQAQCMFFSWKINKVYHPPLLFNNSAVQQISTQKHLGAYVDEELTFKHIKEKTNKTNKGILPCSTLWTIYQSFVLPHLDYGDVIYDQPENKLVSSKIESFQCNVSLAIPGARIGTSQKNYIRDYVESLRSRRYLWRMCFFYKLIETQNVMLFLFNLITPKLKSLHHPYTFSVRRCRSNYFKNSFMPYVARKWNKLNTEICNSTF